MAENKTDGSPNSTASAHEDHFVNVRLGDKLKSQSPQLDGPRRTLPLRYFVVVLGFFALCLCTMTRSIFNNLLSDINKAGKQRGNSCPDPSLFIPTNDISSTIPSTVLYQTTARMYSYETQLTTNAESSTASTPTTNGKPKVEWTPFEERVLVCAFYLSYSLFMVFGGRIAEVYGSMYVILVSVASCTLTNFATPFLAVNSFFVLLLMRIFLGVTQAGILPAIYALVNNWTTHNESLFFVPQSKVFLRLGQLLAASIPKVFDVQASFYFAGGLCLISSLAWFKFAQSKPQDSALISEQELKHILKKKKEHQSSVAAQLGAEELELAEEGTKKEAAKRSKPSNKTPWRAILTHKSVLMLICAKFGFNFAFDFFIQYLPMYLTNVYHYSLHEKSSVLMSLSGIQLFVGMLMPILVRYVTLASLSVGLTVTFVRRLFQLLTCGGMALGLVLMTRADCSRSSLEFGIYVFALGSTFSAGGDVLLPYDLTRKYPATIMGIINSCANLGSFLLSPVSNLVLGDLKADFDLWTNFILIVASVVGVFGLMFVLFVVAEPVDFDASKKVADVGADVGADVESAPDSCDAAK